MRPDAVGDVGGARRLRNHDGKVAFDLRVATDEGRLLGREAAASGTLAVSLGVVVLLLVGGLYYFRRMERTFADVV